jgi:hypothetical protein
VGRSPGGSQAFLAGVRSPPLRGGGQPSTDGLRTRPGDGARAVFSEGRTLCVRVARPHECRGIPFVPLDDGKRPAGLPGTCLGQGQAFPCGRAEPAPPRGRPSQLRWPPGARPGDGVKGGFLGGTHSVRPRCEAPRMPRHSISTRMRPRGPSYRGMFGLARCFPLRACGARPSAGRPSEQRWPYGGKPGDDAKGGFLGGTHSVRPLSMAKRKPRHLPRDSVFTGWPSEAWSPTGTCPGGSQYLSLRACGARPSAGG